MNRSALSFGEVIVRRAMTVGIACAFAGPVGLPLLTQPTKVVGCYDFVDPESFGWMEMNASRVVSPASPRVELRGDAAQRSLEHRAFAVRVPAQRDARARERWEGSSYWWMPARDSVTIVWNDGFGGREFHMKVQVDSLIGFALDRGDSHVAGEPPPIRRQQVAVRVACVRP